MNSRFCKIIPCFFRITIVRNIVSYPQYPRLVLPLHRTHRTSFFFFSFYFFLGVCFLFISDFLFVGFYVSYLQYPRQVLPLRRTQLEEPPFLPRTRGYCSHPCQDFIKPNMCQSLTSLYGILLGNVWQ